MFRNARRRIYRKIRFKTWYRKINYYHRKHPVIDSYLQRFCSPEQLSDRAFVRKLKSDMVRSLFKYGSYFDEYFLFGFPQGDHEYRDSFITEGIRMSFYPRMNNPRNTNMLENKYLTYKKFTPMFKRDMMCIRSHDEPTPERIEQFARFAREHETYMVKPLYAAFGKGVHKDSLSNYEDVEQAYMSYHERGSVLEELIIQDPRMAVIHPASVNTLRVPTAIINDADGKPQVTLFNPTLRVGKGGSVVDNFSAGGISALIDPETGIIFTDGADKKGNHYDCHPDTGVCFKGFQIPQWQEVVSIVKEAAMMVPDNHYCGWDLALFEGRGWCMVEANCTAQMGGMQLVTRTGRKHELEALIARMTPQQTGGKRK